MKKIFTLFALAAIFSCTQELDPVVPENPAKDDPEVVDPENNDPDETNPTVPEGMISLTFTVSSEKDAKTKTHLGDKDPNNEADILWDENDEIRIIWGTGESDYVDAKVEDDGEGHYTVTANVSASAETLYAVYPTTGAFALREGGTIDFGIPRYQNGTFKSANMMAARTTKEAASFAFKNLTHIIKFHTTAANPYNRFEFTSNGLAKVIANTYGVTFDEEQNVTVGARTAVITGYDNTKYANLNSIATNTAKDYYFAVGPGADFDTGFGVKARKSNSGDLELGALSKRAITTTRSHVTDLGDIDPMIHADWFIKTTADGKGDGSSWNNAGDLSLFLKLIKNKTNDNGVNSTWRLHNAKIHFAEGTYNIQAANGGTLTFQSGAWDTGAEKPLANINLIIDGGYPSSNTGTSLEGKHAVNHATKWVSNDTETDRIFYLNGATMNGWTFDSITFTQSAPSTAINTRGIAFFFNSTAAGNVTFKDCIFCNLNSSSTLGGAAIDFNATGELNVKFDGCTFSDNIASGANAGYGGAIVMEVGDDTVVTIENCIADNNDVTSSNGQGGYIAQRAGTIYIKGGTIQNSTSIANGGAIYQHDGTMDISFGQDSTKFVSNVATSKRGGAILTKGTLIIDKASFRLNNGSNGGAIHLEAGADVTITNATFKRNSATNAGAIRTDGATTLSISKSMFEYNTGTGTGGAMQIQASCAATISDETTFLYNSAGNGSGGAIHNSSSNLSIDGTTISNNSAANGGAIYTSEALTFTGCDISYNTASGSGGAIHNSSSNLSIDGTTISNNSAANGGAIYTSGALTLTGCDISNNTASGSGGGINITQTTANYVPVTIYNTAITGNTATGGAGGVYSKGKNDLIMVNCTVSGNNGTNAGGIYVTRQDNDTYKANITRLAMISCTVTGNTASAGTGGIYKETFSQVVDVYNSIISGNTGTSTNDDVRNDRLLYHVDKSIVVATSYTSADRVNNTGAGNFVWRKSVLSNPSAFDINTMLSSLSDGVHAVTTVADNPAISCGMTSEELSGLTLRYTPTQTVDTSFLTIDQKGNDRNGTIMGAYVGN